jgi:hypothetical protein
MRKVRHSPCFGILIGSKRPSFPFSIELYTILYSLIDCSKSLTMLQSAYAKSYVGRLFDRHNAPITPLGEACIVERVVKRVMKRVAKRVVRRVGTTISPFSCSTWITQPEQLSYHHTWSTRVGTEARSDVRNPRRQIHCS